MTLMVSDLYFYSLLGIVGIGFVIGILLLFWEYFFDPVYNRYYYTIKTLAESLTSHQEIDDLLLSIEYNQDMFTKQEFDYLISYLTIKRAYLYTNVTTF